ncbi:MAG: carbon-nitrogen hydrolase family protein [Burkholderiales bacterium]|nr:carbon-nitrogen hydrolase family protein [Burkholderiales bacterium]
MGDRSAAVKVAAVQAASVFLERERSTAKACALIREAGRRGARVIGFPESFIPAHPVWYHHHPATGTLATDLAVALFKNSIEIPGPEVEALCAAAGDANAYVVVGVCEKLPRTLGTLYNTQLYIAPDGRVLGMHRKLMPTGGERLVHTGGAADTFGAIATEFGPMSALICGENSNPLAICALAAQGTRIHVMSWPSYLGRAPLGNRVAVDAQAFARMCKSYVIAACGVIDDTLVAALRLDAAQAQRLREPGRCGGSLVVAPDGRVAAGPLGAQESILYAECDVAIAARMRSDDEFAGHWSRPDIFQLRVRRSAPRIYTVSGGPPPADTLPRAAGTVARRLDGRVSPPARAPRNRKCR